MDNPFFKNTGPYNIKDLLKLVNLNNETNPDEKINDIKDISSAQSNEITFFIQKNISI